MLNILFSVSQNFTTSDVSSTSSNKTRGEKAIQFAKFPMNEVAELKKNFPNMSLLVIRDDEKKPARIMEAGNLGKGGEVQTSESPFQTTFESAGGKNHD